MKQRGGTGPFGLLAHSRSFRRLWIGESASVLGDRVTGLALPLTAVLVLHAGHTAMGYLTAVELVPYLLLSIPVGVWLDRRGRRRPLMIVADMGRAVSLLSIPATFIIGELTLGQMYWVAGLVGMFQVVFDLSCPSLVTSMVGPDQYMAASTLLQGSRAASHLVGPGFAGLLVKRFTAPFTLVVDAASFVASAVGLASVQVKETPAGPPQPRDFMEGLRFVWTSKGIRLMLLAFSTVNLFNYMFSTLFVLYATRSLRIQPDILGLIFSVGAVGTALGAVVAGRLARKIGMGKSLFAGVGLFTVPLILVPLASGHRIDILIFLVLAEFLSGFGVMILDISFGSLSLSLVPSEILSRATGAFSFLNYGIRPFGALIGGWLPGLVGVRNTLWIATIGACCGCLWLLPRAILGIRDGAVRTAASDAESV